MALNPQLLRDSFNLVIDREPQTIARFYEILFDRHPQARPLFGRNTPQKQQQMLQETLVAALDRLEDGAWLTDTLAALGRKHAGYGVTEEMYGWVGESLLLTLAEVAGRDWTPEVEGAWTEAYLAIRDLMLAGGREVEALARPA